MSTTLPTSELSTAEPGQRKRLLLVSYHFPPVGGAGVQRPVKFVKYLEQFGWTTSVLMAANPSVPVTDDSLCKDIPAETLIVKARTREPGYRLKQNLATGHPQQSKAGFKTWCRQRVGRLARWGAGIVLQPDAQILWYPAALKAGKQMLREHQYDAILATAPPYSNLILGSQLSKISGLPLIVDFRDEWDLSSKYLENSAGDWFSARVQSRMQQKILRQAQAIIATTESSTRRLQQKAIAAGSMAEAICIYNGYDEEDFVRQAVATDNDSPVSDDRPLRIVYTGTLWNLTSVEPVVQAIELLAQKQVNDISRISFQFIGRKTEAQLQLLQRLAATGCQLELVDYCDHARALDYLQNADALCLLLSDVEGAERVVPAKLFEYLAMQKEILAIVPAGESADILSRFCSDSVFPPADVQRISHWFAHRLNQSASTAATHRLEEINEFSRSAQAGQLAELLYKMCHAKA